MNALSCVRNFASNLNLEKTPLPWVIALTAAAAISCSTVSIAEPAPDGPSVMMDGAVWTYDGDATPQGSFETVDDPDATEFNLPEGAIGPLHEMTTADNTTTPWSAALRSASTNSIQRGDVLHARFWARCTHSMTGQANGTLNYERASGDYDKSIAFPFSLDSQWRLIEIPFVAHDSFDERVAQVSIHLGYPTQTVQIAGFALVNLGPDANIDDLPFSAAIPRSYDGAADDAPWRERAAAMIEAHRMTPIQVRVVNAAGLPIPDASVRIEMERSAFAFGTAVTAPMLTEDSADARRYREIVQRMFNEVVFENDMKWRYAEMFGDWEQTDAAVAWLVENNFTIRGHTLIWPSWRYVPDNVQPLADDPQALAAAADDRVRSMAGRYAGQLLDWDVVNEPYTNYELTDVLGPEAIAGWFRLAHEIDPEAQLYLNDYSILSGGGNDVAHQDSHFNTIKGLLDAGVPIHGIGMQGHFGGELTSPETLWAILDRFATLGLKIKVTEFDINAKDEALKASYLADFLTAMYAHPAVEGVLQWGFWSERHWRPDAALFDADWTPRPAVAAYEALVLETWRTETQGTTDATGHYATTGHRGDYLIIVEVDGSLVTQRTTFDPQDESSAVVDIVLESP